MPPGAARYTARMTHSWPRRFRLPLLFAGLFALVGLPYTLKFLWAPLLDRFAPISRMGRRRGWLLLIQITLIAAIAAINGTGPELSTAGGTSDARFVAQYCPVVECGLPGPTMHKADEHVAVADVVALTRLYGAFIAAYFAT